MEEVQRIHALLEFMVRLMVLKPDAVLVTVSTPGPGRAVFHVSVAHEDAGRIIGKGGGTANALRNLLHAIGTTKGLKINLELAH